MQIFPSTIQWLVTDNDLQSPNYLDKARTIKNLYKSYIKIFKKAPFCTTHFKSTDKFVTSKISIKLACKVLMSDTPYCHPDAVYWTADLNYSIMLDLKVDPTLDIKAVTTFSDSVLWTNFFY